MVFKKTFLLTENRFTLSNHCLCHSFEQKNSQCHEFVLQFELKFVRTKMEQYLLSIYRRIVRRFFHKTSSVVHPLHDDQSKPIKKEHRSPKLDFAYTFRPIFYCSRLCGIMTFSMNHDSDGEFLKPRVSRQDVLWFMLWLCINSFMVVVFHKYGDFPFTNAVSPSLYFGEKIVGILPTLGGGLFSILNLYNRFKIVETLNTFKVFDLQVNYQT